MYAMLFLYMHADMLRSVCHVVSLHACRHAAECMPCCFSTCMQTCCGVSEDGNYLLAGSGGSQNQGAELTVSHMHVATCTCSLDMYVWYNVVYTLVVGIFDRFGTEEERGNP